MPLFEAGLKVEPSRPAKAAVSSTIGFCETTCADPFDRRLGAVERGAGRKLDDADQEALVLIGDEAGRRRVQPPDGQARAGRHR